MNESPARARGATIGALLGAVAILVPFAWFRKVEALGWLAAAIPAGAAAGAVGAKWVRPGQRISWLGVLASATVADLIGGTAIVTIATIAAAIGSLPSGSNPVAFFVASTVAVLFLGGGLALIPLLPTAWIGSWLLRRWLRPS